MTYLETPDEAPYVNIFVTNEGEIYCCRIFLYPESGEHEKSVDIRIEVNYEDWNIANRFQ